MGTRGAKQPQVGGYAGSGQRQPEGRADAPLSCRSSLPGGNKYRENAAPQKSLHREQAVAPERKTGSAAGIYAKATELCTLKSGVL